jgi:hypothetical protein
VGSLRGATVVQTNPGVGGTPPDDIANLAVWFQADALSGFSNGDPVAVWPDLSGNNWHASQTDLAKRLTYMTGLQNGLPGVRADEVDDIMTTGYTVALGDFTVIAAFRDRLGVVQSERLVDKNFVTGFYLGRNSTGANSWGGGIMQTSPPYGTFVTLSDASAHILSMRRSGTSQTIRGDGNTATASDNVSASALSTAPLCLGADQDANAVGGIDLYGFVLYSSALTDPQQAGVELWVAQRWGITIT